MTYYDPDVYRQLSPWTQARVLVASTPSCTGIPKVTQAEKRLVGTFNLRLAERGDVRRVRRQHALNPRYPGNTARNLARAARPWTIVRAGDVLGEYVDLEDVAEELCLPTEYPRDTKVATDDVYAALDTPQTMREIGARLNVQRHTAYHHLLKLMDEGLVSRFQREVGEAHRTPYAYYRAGQQIDIADYVARRIAQSTVLVTDEHVYAVLARPMTAGDVFACLGTASRTSMRPHLENLVASGRVTRTKDERGIVWYERVKEAA